MQFDSEEQKNIAILLTKVADLQGKPDQVAVLSSKILQFRQAAMSAEVKPPGSPPKEVLEKEEKVLKREAEEKKKEKKGA